MGAFFGKSNSNNDFNEEETPCSALSEGHTESDSLEEEVEENVSEICSYLNEDSITLSLARNDLLRGHFREFMTSSGVNQEENSSAIPSNLELSNAESRHIKPNSQASWLKNWAQSSVLRLSERIYHVFSVIGSPGNFMVNPFIQVEAVEANPQDEPENQPQEALNLAIDIVEAEEAVEGAHEQDQNGEAPNNAQL